MRTISFRDGVLYAIVYMLGLKPATLLPEKAAALVNYINRRVEQYWDRADWPEWIITEPRTPDLNHIVAWNQTGQTVIEKVFRVYLRDPTAVRSGAMDTPFKLTAAGIYCGLEHGNQVWLKYFPRPENWVTRTYNRSGTGTGTISVFDPLTGASTYITAPFYTAGDVIYDAASGECYRAVVNLPAGTTPVFTDTTKWTQLPFPYALAGAVRHGVFADALREDGQNDKAAAEEQMSEQLFAQAAGVLARENVDSLSDQEATPARYGGPMAKA